VVHETTSVALGFPQQETTMRDPIIKARMYICSLKAFVSERVAVTGKTLRKAVTKSRQLPGPCSVLIRKWDVIALALRLNDLVQSWPRVRDIMAWDGKRGGERGRGKGKGGGRPGGESRKAK
jgi:hypothetical protein